MYVLLYQKNIISIFEEFIYYKNIVLIEMKVESWKGGEESYTGIPI